MEVDPSVIQDMLRFLRGNDVAVLATVREGNIAHATTIYYYVEDDLRFYFLTRNETMKFTNLRNNGTVGLVVTDPKSLQTVQVEGVAKEVDYAHEYAATIKKYTDNLVKNGQTWENIPLNHMQNTGYYSFIQVTPTWIRWTDFANWAHKVKFEQHYT